MPYEPKNVLITGGAGFIASHVAILFAKKYPHCKVSKETLFFFFFFFCLSSSLTSLSLTSFSNFFLWTATLLGRLLCVVRFEANRIDKIFHRDDDVCFFFSLSSFSLSFFGWNTTDNLLNFTSSSSSSSCSFIRSSFSISSIIAPT